MGKQNNNNHGINDLVRFLQTDTLRSQSIIISHRVSVTCYKARDLDKYQRELVNIQYFCGLTKAQRLSPYTDHPPQLTGGAGEEKISRKPEDTKIQNTFIASSQLNFGDVDLVS